MKILHLISTLSFGILFAAGLFAISPAVADETIVFELSGLQEVPAVITDGVGRGRVRVQKRRDRIQVGIDYADLDGSIKEAHLHLGQEGVNGGVMAWICVDRSAPVAEKAPPGTAGCTGTEGRVVVDITRDDVVGPANQGIDKGELTAVEEAIRSGVAYINVHTSQFPAGELRGQVMPAERHESDDLEDRFDELEDALENHSHAYRTGRGQGHNNSSAQTGRAKF